MKTKERVYILPTRYGVMYAAGILVTLMAGTIYANNLVYLLSFFLVALFLIGMVQSHANLKGVHVEKLELRLAPSNASGDGTVWLKSCSEEGHNQIRIEDKQGIVDFMAGYIPGRSQHIQRIKYTTHQRGRKTLSRVKVSTHFPFGLFHAWKYDSVDCTYFVYPKPEGGRDLPESFFLGESVDSFDGKRGDDYSQHKRYEIGESQKHIDWKAFARGRPLLVKEFNDGDRRSIELNLLSIKGPIEDKLKQLSQWIQVCHENKYVYSLRLDQESEPAKTGLQHRNRCLKKLAEFGVKSA